MSQAERNAIEAAAAQAGESVPAFDFTQPVLSTVFASFSFSAKVGA